MKETINMPNESMSALPDKSVVCLMAPTASGKTALAYELYDTGRFEIISVDSALIYRDMNIGTAKPTPAELRQYPHYMVDIISPTETYSVASFVDQVAKLIDQIHANGKIPLLVGGTMMYYMAMFTGLSPVPDTDLEIRAEVEAWRQDVGIEALHTYLQAVDPVIAERLNTTDTQRITRALEVYKQTGKPLSAWQQLPKQAIADNPAQFWLGLAVMPDRVWLHERIELRLQIMWQEGFVDEVLALIDKYPLTTDTPSLRCVGYRQVIDYLIAINHPAAKQLVKDNHINELGGDQFSVQDKEIAYQEMQNRALYATRQLAKRQYTWLRNLIKTHANDSKLTVVDNKKLSSNSVDDNYLSYGNSTIENKTVELGSTSKVIYPFSDITNAKQFLFTYL